MYAQHNHRLEITGVDGETSARCSCGWTIRWETESGKPIGVNTNTLSNEDLEILTDAFVEKSKMVWGMTDAERLRSIIQMVIIDTMITVEGTLSVDDWKPERTN